MTFIWSLWLFISKFDGFKVRNSARAEASNGAVAINSDRIK